MINLNNLKIGKRLALGFGLTGSMMVAGTILALHSINAINLSMKDSLAEARKMQAIQRVEAEAGDVYLNLWNVIGESDANKKEAHRRELDKARATYLARVEELKASAKTEEGRKLLGELESVLTVSREINQRVLASAVKGETAKAMAVAVSEGDNARERLEGAVHHIVQWREKRIKEMNDFADAELARARMRLIGGVTVGVALAFVFGLIITRSVSRPLGLSVGLLGRVSGGDVSEDVPAELRTREDEAGDLGRSLQTMMESLRSLLREVSGGVRTLAAASTELSSVSTQMTTGARQTSAKASTVAAAAEEMSANSQSVAAGMEEATSSLTTMATSTEQMTSTISEIATKSEQARMITTEATEQAGRVTGRMQDLSQAAQDIGKVTETITSISDQTRLLALNATIEAARAGAAGKGFAVVAHEIKELARQTAKATEDIKVKVDGIQSSTRGTLTDLEQISRVISQISEIVNTIASAIEEQTAVTKDIAQNVSEAAGGVKDANQRVAQMAVVSQSVAQDISGVNQAAGEMASGSEKTLTSSAELAKLAEDLHRMVARFRVGADSGAARQQTPGRASSGGITGDTSHSTGAARPFIEWTDDLSVGVPAMDAHHRKLVDLINQLHTAMRSGKGALAVGPALEELAKYAGYHFGAEEKLMREHKCSGLAEQQAAHSELVDRVSDLRQQLASGQHGLGVEVLNMLKDWLVNHIQRKDKPCMNAVCASRARGNGNGNGHPNSTLARA